MITFWSLSYCLHTHVHTCIHMRTCTDIKYVSFRVLGLPFPVGTTIFFLSSVFCIFGFVFLDLYLLLSLILDPTRNTSHALCWVLCVHHEDPACVEGRIGCPTGGEWLGENRGQHATSIQMDSLFCTDTVFLIKA